MRMTYLRTLYICYVKSAVAIWDIALVLIENYAHIKWYQWWCKPHHKISFVCIWHLRFIKYLKVSFSCLHFQPRPLLQSVGTVSKHSSLHLHLFRNSCLHFQPRPLLQSVGTVSKHTSLHLHLFRNMLNYVSGDFIQPPRVKFHARESTPESLSLPNK